MILAMTNEATGELGAWIFFAMVIAFAVKSYREGNSINLKNLDLVTVGYVADPPCTTLPPLNTFESQQLYIDCIDALYTLGYKKSEAKKKAKLIFSTFSPQPQSVQEFLMIALKP